MFHVLTITESRIPSKLITVLPGIHQMADTSYVCVNTNIKATFSFHKLIPENAQMTTLYTNWSLYITFTMIYYI